MQTVLRLCLLSVLVATLLLTSCREELSEKQEVGNALLRFGNALEADDLSTARNLLARSVREECNTEALLGFIALDFDGIEGTIGGVAEVSVSGDRAGGRLKFLGTAGRGGESSPFDLVKEGGGWRLTGSYAGGEDGFKKAFCD